jgi:hypothetical protein
MWRKDDVENFNEHGFRKRSIFSVHPCSFEHYQK